MSPMKCGMRERLGGAEGNGDSDGGKKKAPGNACA